jgi:hypothetical protein
MSNTLYHSSIAISVAMLVMMSSSPVFAKPQPKSQVMVISQAVAKASVIDGISPQPIEAILASVKLRQTSQPKAKKAIARPVAAKSELRMIKTDYYINADRSSRGIESFINVDRVKSRKYHAPAIDQWTN